MKPIEFEQMNTIFSKDSKVYMPLPAEVKDLVVEGPNGEQREFGNGRVITCWELSDEDIAEIVKNKKVWLGILTYGEPLQPVSITTKREDLL